MNLAEFNAAARDAAEAALLECCSSAGWARRVAAARPFASLDTLYEAADAALNDLDDTELQAALSGHPRIGERAGAGHAASSGREQSAVAQSSTATLDALAEGNREYEARFGHVYLVCADGRSGEDLLAVLRDRLRAEPAAEWATTRRELGKINRLRLARLIAADARGSGS